jgi:hypothetical protein
MGRHLLDPVSTESAVAVVRRLGAVPATSGVTAEMTVATRRTVHRSGDVERALADGLLIKTFAFRGATYVMAPEEASMYLTLRAASRMWERPSWRKHYGLQPSDWPHLREAVREALTEGPLTPQELGTAISALRRFRHLGPAFSESSATFLKPFAWHGDMSFGPPRDGRATLQRLDQNPRWPGLRDVDTAGRDAVEAYLRTCGPATQDHVRYWLGNALGVPRRLLDTWWSDLGDRLTTVDIDGRSLSVLSEDHRALVATSASTAVRLLPAYDPWIMGPGTADVHVVPAAQRALLSRGANPVIVGGVVSGIWKLIDDKVAVTWFGEHGSAPSSPLAQQVARLATILGRPLEPSVRSAPVPS